VDHCERHTTLKLPFRDFGDVVDAHEFAQRAYTRVRTLDEIAPDIRSCQVLRATITERVQPGVVYTTFHFPASGANIVTTDFSDWATNCPEYKVTAVQIGLLTRAPDDAAFAAADPGVPATVDAGAQR